MVTPSTRSPYFTLPATWVRIGVEKGSHSVSVVPGFTRWVEDRRELSHLLGHANLNT